MTGPYMGYALVPYFPQLLPILNILRSSARIDVNRSGEIDYSRKVSLVDKIDETIELMERRGGPDAFANIKYSVPTYESCVHN